MMRPHQRGHDGKDCAAAVERSGFSEDKVIGILIVPWRSPPEGRHCNPMNSTELQVIAGSGRCTAASWTMAPGVTKIEEGVCSNGQGPTKPSQLCIPLKRSTREVPLQTTARRKPKQAIEPRAGCPLGEPQGETEWEIKEPRS